MTLIEQIEARLGEMRVLQGEIITLSELHAEHNFPDFFTRYQDLNARWFKLSDELNTLQNLSLTMQKQRLDGLLDRDEED
jgi:hypothetical protein